jgi:multidrug efflux pump subunit AcrA (membrane-fusion protein)
LKNAAVLIVGAWMLGGCAIRGPAPAAVDAVAAPAGIGPATPVEYEISFPAAAHHEAEVRITDEIRAFREAWLGSKAAPI